MFKDGGKENNIFSFVISDRKGRVDNDRGQGHFREENIFFRKIHEFSRDRTREEGEIGKSVEKIRQVFNERQRRCGWPTKLMLSPPTPNLQTRGRLAAIMFTMPRLADAGHLK